MTDIDPAFAELCLQNTGCKTKAEHVLRAGGVVRYHNEPGVSKQRVDCHTWRVLAILLSIWPDSSRELIISVQWHDTEEGLTGDLPAPLKWGNPELKKFVDEMGNRYAHGVVGLPRFELTKYEIARMKCADYLELADHCSNEYTPAANRIMQLGLKAVSKYAEALHPADLPPLRAYVSSMRDKWADSLRGRDSERSFRADIGDMISVLGAR